MSISAVIAPEPLAEKPEPALMMLTPVMIPDPFVFTVYAASLVPPLIV